MLSSGPPIKSTLKRGYRYTHKYRKVKQIPIYSVYSSNEDRLFCAVSISTTGPDPVKHEACIVRAIAADASMQIIPEAMPFSAVIAPQDPENYLSHQAAEAEYGYTGISQKDFKLITSSGINIEAARAAFFNWAFHIFPEKMQNPKFIPLAINWGKISPFLTKFFGWKNEYTPAIADLFDIGDVRDLSTIVGYYSELFMFALKKGENKADQNDDKKTDRKKRVGSSPLSSLRKVAMHSANEKVKLRQISRLDLDALCSFFDVQPVSKANAYYEPLSLLRVYPFLTQTASFVDF